jgi:hypothetical protein
MLVSAFGLLTLGVFGYFLFRYREDVKDCRSRIERHMRWHSDTALNRMTESPSRPVKKQAQKKKVAKKP